MIISLDAKKAFNKITTSLHDKGLGESRDTRNIPKHNKFNIQQSTANIKLNVEKLTVFPLKPGTRQGCPLSLIYSV